MSRPHENDENHVSFSMKAQTFENAHSIGVVWTGQFKGLVMWSQSQSTFIWKGGYRQRAYCCCFIGISLLLSLTVNWQLNVYAHETPSTHALCKGGCGGVGWREVDNVFSRFRRFPVDGQTIRKRYFHYVFSKMKTEAFENASVWKRPKTKRQDNVARAASYLSIFSPSLRFSD